MSPLVALLVSGNADRDAAGALAQLNAGELLDCMKVLRSKHSNSATAPRDPRLITGLVYCLTHRDREVAERAGAMLARIGGAAVDPLAAALDAQLNVHWLSAHPAKVLGEIGDARAVPSLAKALHTWRSRQTLIGSAAVDPLAAALDAQLEIHWLSAHPAKVLGEIGDALAAPSLAKALDNWRSHQTLIVRALGQIGGPEALPHLVGVAQTERDGHEARLCAIEALGVRGDAAAVAPLILLLGSRQSVEVRCSAARALGNIGDPGAVEALIALLDSGQRPEVRCEAVEALGTIGDSRAVEPLTRALSDSARAASALQKLGEGTLVDEWTRIFAIGPAGECTPADSRLVRPLHAVLQECEAPWRAQCAAKALANIGGESATAALVGAIEHPSPSVRCEVALGLSRLGVQQSVPALATLLDRTDWAPAIASELARWGYLAGPAIPALRLCARRDRDHRRVYWQAIRTITSSLRAVAPAELLSSSAPDGTGTELEASAAPEGNGTALQARLGSASEPEVQENLGIVGEPGTGEG